MAEINKFKNFFLISVFILAGIFCLQIVFFKNTNYALAAEKININTASIEELETLSGIGEAKAQAIIDYRILNGPFAVIEDIINVSGIGTATFNKIKDFITVGEDEISFCGDGVIDEGEQCDDGNNIGGDGCSFDCKIEQAEENFLDSIVINEFVSDPISGEEEWVELYSNFDEVINLEGWIIEEGAGSTTNLSGEILPGGFIVFDDITGNLNNAGDIIFLKNSNGDVVDGVVYGNWDDGNINDNVPKADDPYSVARAVDGVDTNIDNNDFVITSITTKGKTNVIDSQDTDEELEDHDVVEIISTDVVPGTIVFNEIVSDPRDGPEWVELYNRTSRKIDLSGWSIEEGSEAETVLDGEIGGYEYLVIENIKGNLNNVGDIIFLFDDYRNIIDQVAYGNWDDGNINDNAPKVSDPNGIGRIGVSQDTNNDFSDWQIVSVLSKGFMNILADIGEEELFSDLRGKIIINEIFPNPSGSDEGEFIELKNISDVEIDLSGVVVGDNSKRRYKIDPSAGGGVKIGAGEFFVILRRVSKIALNNTGGDGVVLYDDGNNLIDEVGYLEKAFEGKSYSFIEGEWQWSGQPSKGVENILVQENQLPVAVIDFDKSDVFVGEEVVLDCSDSYDLDGDDLIIEWSLDEVLYHSPIWKLKLDEVGSYEVVLMLSDGEEKVFERMLINVITRGNGNSVSSVETEFPLRLPLINEFVPNPEGSDENEFIEVFNPNDFEIDLNGFYIDDKDGGSRAYQINNVVLEPFSYFVFERGDTKVALNNDSDSVRLLDGNKDVLQQVDYSNVVEGASFARSFDGNWFWTDVVTKGEENQIVFVDEDNLVDFDQKIGLGFADVIELDQVREVDLGEKIVTRGVVSAEPGILGVQIFYVSGFKTLQPPFAKGGNIENPPTPLIRGASAGIQVYSYKKDFPELSVGDEVEVAGILSQSGGEVRLKIKNKDDVKILKHYDDIEPVKISAYEVGEEIEGGFVMIEGEIVEISGSSVFVDDGTGEVKVYIKKSSGVSRAGLSEGDFISVAGIVSETSSGYRLLPRYQDDIKKIETLGVEMESGENSDIVIEPRGGDFLKYVITTLAAVALILLAVIFRAGK